MLKTTRSQYLSLGLKTSLALIAISIGTTAEAQFQPGIGIPELRALAGASNVDGSGVSLLQVEAESDPLPNDEIERRDYFPDVNNGELSSKTFTDIGTPGLTSTGSNGHATGVALSAYGSVSGTAPGVGNAGSPAVSMHGANDFINNELGSTSGRPTAQNFDVSNHSYILSFRDAAGNFVQNAAEDRINRLDFVINDGNMTTAVGSSNTFNNTPVAGLIHAYNTINVGVTDGSHAAGLTTFNGAGRNSIHVVVDDRFTSVATAHVSGAAAILHQTGNGMTNANRQEVIKATILAGATKDDLLDAARNPVVWNPTTNPLDNRYGAGELNVLNNHLIQQGGQVNGGLSSATAGTAGVHGWDYERDLNPNDDRYYEFTVGANEAVENFSIVLTWNLEVVNRINFGSFFQPRANPLADLSLELIDLSDNSTVDLSDSAVDNVEHIFLPTLPTGTYQLRVANSSTNVDTDYGLAFGGTVVSTVLLGDCNFDGFVNFVDIGFFISAVSTGTFLEPADCNEDGFVNFVDIGFFIAILNGQ